MGKQNNQRERDEKGIEKIPLNLLTKNATSVII